MANEGSTIINSISAFVDAEARNGNSVEHNPNHVVRNGIPAANGTDPSIIPAYPNGTYTRNGSFREQNGISTGIILNPFVNPRSVSDDEIGSKSKPLELTQSEISGELKVIDKIQKKAKMSPLRKIVFGMSFLPSIMFVLAFSILLPCQKPYQPDACLKAAWIHSFADQGLEILSVSSNDVVVGLSSNGTNSIIGLDSEFGDELWKMPSSLSPSYINCEDIDVNNDGLSDCLVRIKDQLFAMNASDGYIFWRCNVSGDGLPALLLDPGKDGLQKAAITYDRRLLIIIISNGTVLSDFKIKSEACATQVDHLLPWVHENSTDLLFSCTDDKGDAVIWRIEEKDWCNSKTDEVEYQKYYHFKGGNSLSNWLFLPTFNGLVVWMEDFIVLCHKGSEIWKTNTTDFTNRFLQHGNFLHGSEIVYGGYVQERSQIRFQRIQDGSLIATWISPNKILTQAIAVRGEHKDYLVASLEINERLPSFQKIENADLPIAFAAAAKQPVFSRNTENTLENNVTLVKAQTIKQTITLLELEEKDSKVAISEKDIFAENHVILQKTDNRKTRISAYKQKTDLMLILGRTQLELSDGNILENKTYLQALKSNNWDILLSRCKFLWH